MRKFRNLNLLFNTDAGETGGAADAAAAETAAAAAGDAAAGTAEGTQGDETATSTATAGESASTATGQESATGETFSKAYVEKLRRENAAAREKAKTDAAAAAEAAKTELTQSIGKALGLITDDEQVEPAKLIEQAQADREKALAEAKSTKRDLAVLRNADKHDANTEELLDSRDFAGKLKDLDPDADDFASQVDALIKSAVDSNPARFKRVQVAAAAGGASHTGESGQAAAEGDDVDSFRKSYRESRGLKD